MNIFTRIRFILKRPKIIIVTGEGRKSAKEAIFQVLNQYPQAAKDILLSESDLKNPHDVEELKFLINKSSLFIFVVIHIEEVDEDKSSSPPFAAARVREVAQEIQKLAKMMPASGRLILNFDDQAVREMVATANLRTFTFGFQSGSDFQVSDINLNPVRESEKVENSKSIDFSNGVNGGTNFKINYKGSIVPVWLEGICDKEQIYAALAAACVGTIFDLNLIEISQALKNYHFEKRD